VSESSGNCWRELSHSTTKSKTVFIIALPSSLYKLIQRGVLIAEWLTKWRTRGEIGAMRNSIANGNRLLEDY